MPMEPLADAAGLGAAVFREITLGAAIAQSHARRISNSWHGHRMPNQYNTIAPGQCLQIGGLPIGRRGMPQDWQMKQA